MVITVDQGFIDQRDERAGIYNPGNRTIEQLKRDIECEIHEYMMIREGVWEDHESWKVDGVAPGIGNVDVKFIDKYYNISHKKMAYLCWQSTHVHYFIFMEWVRRPDRLLRVGDEVEYRQVGVLSYDEFLKHVRPSNYNSGYYVHVRSVCKRNN